MINWKKSLIGAGIITGMYLSLTCLEYAGTVGSAQRELAAWKEGKPDSSFSTFLDRVAESDYVWNSFNPLYRLTHSRTEETQKNKDKMMQDALSTALASYVQ
ncbi:MAG: hypothetical protein V2A62_05550 [Candidatus Woesearchaeota archaeon]